MKPDRTRIRIGLAPWIQIHIEIKSWIRIRPTDQWERRKLYMLLEGFFSINGSNKHSILWIIIKANLSENHLCTKKKLKIKFYDILKTSFSWDCPFNRPGWVRMGSDGLPEEKGEEAQYQEQPQNTAHCLGLPLVGDGYCIGSPGKEPSGKCKWRNTTVLIINTKKHSVQNNWQTDATKSSQNWVLYSLRTGLQIRGFKKWVVTNSVNPPIRIQLFS